MDYKEEDFLQISGLQHFAFCRRQWALIHVEQQWAENLRTMEGDILHARAHNGNLKERRGSRLVTRDMRVFSASLGIAGNCDVVEFQLNEKGVPLFGHEGRYLPYPIEYKRGSPRKDYANELQLCAQAMCLEEMLCCEIPKGALYFGETHHRETVLFSAELREAVRANLAEMHKIYEKHDTPKAKASKACNACSLKELCLPGLMRKKQVSAYLADHLEDTP